MRYFCSAGYLGVCAMVFALPSAHAQAEEPLNQDVLDVFKVFEDHDYGIVMLDVDQDGDLDCLTAKRTELDINARTATYVWILKGLHGKEKTRVTFHLKPGPTPDLAVFTLDNADGPEQIVKLLYTDYDACALLEIPYGGKEECMLWGTSESKNNAPQSCVDQFRQHCGTEVVAYDEDTCSQVDDDL
ncbi:uncharacterized protein LOC125943157 [Dermacentor silvarum]|uniref:uncharacterized protein LOC125943157 n=1 Tax=Dermacentor silvarum TaxID=543639 RepID=UPI0021010CBE|nr:uncharacterized protein LOC125943157 [Dermacentor silvarum]